MTVQNVIPGSSDEKGGLVDDLLLQLVSVAVQLQALGAQAERDPESTGTLDDELERLSAEFDRTHAEALSHGIPINTKFEFDRGGFRYSLLLTKDGLEYQPLS